MPHADPVVRRAYMADWKIRNQDRHRLLNKFADAAAHANKRAMRYGCEGVLVADDIRKVFAAGTCHYCIQTPDLLTVDHVLPLHAGGPNTPANIVASCRPCNISKWRSDRPARWGRKSDSCVECGRSDRPHRCYGLCGSCYSRRRWHVERGAAQWPA